MFLSHWQQFDNQFESFYDLVTIFLWSMLQLMYRQEWESNPWTSTERFLLKAKPCKTWALTLTKQINFQGQMAAITTRNTPFEYSKQKYLHLVNIRCFPTQNTSRSLPQHPIPMLSHKMRKTLSCVQDREKKNYRVSYSSKIKFLNICCCYFSNALLFTYADTNGIDRKFNISFKNQANFVFWSFSLAFMNVKVDFIKKKQSTCIRDSSEIITKSLKLRHWSWPFDKILKLILPWSKTKPPMATSHFFRY